MLKSLWWIAVLGAGASLLHNLVVRVRYARGGQSLPWQYAGNLAGALSLILLATAQLVIERPVWFAVSLAGAMILLVVDFLQFWRASRTPR